MADNKIKIMIVEDEGIIAMDMKSKLTELGYEVTAIASSYGEALIKVETNKPHLLLMDVYIQGAINGIETAMYLKQTYEIPSIFVTAYNDKVTIEKILKINALGILQKPFDDTEFEKIMINFSSR